MTHISKVPLLLNVFWMALLALCCPGGGHAAETSGPVLSGQAGRTRLEAARLEVANVRSNIFLTLVELDRVRGERDSARPQFRAFVAQLGKMQELAKAFGQRADEMKRKGDTYFVEAETELRRGKEADKGYQDRKHAYDAINLFMENARTNFLEFNRLLTQIKALLEGTPTGANVKEAKELFANANWRCIDVQKALANIEIELDRLSESLAP